MMERLESDQTFAGRCYHSLFLGEDTDEAEVAAQHMARTNGLVAAFLTAPADDGGRR